MVPSRFFSPAKDRKRSEWAKNLREKYPVARQTFEEADDALGYKLSQLCFEGRKTSFV